MPKKKIPVIIDTNLFISFLIGKRLKGLRKTITNSAIELLFAEQHILELKIVTKRSKFKKYFNPNDVNELINFLYAVGKIVQIKNIPNICRDPKDNFLLGLAEQTKARYLVSGDKDLIEIQKYKNTNIVTIDAFEKILKYF